ncbi:MAG: DUF2974 domain-containing protein [Clostridia bacterium]|nr:DUF2974 domain-containing protein [Clostridia bacterium]
MANLFDYLDWRADVPFSVAPFNEVDNLVLSMLSYTKFDGIVSGGASEISLCDAADAFFSVHSKEDIEKHAVFSNRAPLLLPKMLDGARFCDIRLRNYMNVIDKETDSQVSAVTFLLSDGTAFAAFRGTDETYVGWKEDFNFSYREQTGGQRAAAVYLDRVGDAAPRLRVGGHSKGGNFAVYASAFCSESVQSRIETVYTNDGPGLIEPLTKSEAYKRILPRIRSIVPDSSVVGMLLSRGYEHKVIKSSARAVLQHDGFTWSVERDRFTETTLSDHGKFTEQALGSWIGGLSDAERAAFTETVFDILEGTGTEGLDELNEKKLRGLDAVIRAMRKMPRERQREFLRVMRSLNKSIGKTARSRMSEELLLRMSAGLQTYIEAE